MGLLNRIVAVGRFMATWAQQPQTVARLETKVDDLTVNHLPHIAEKLDRIKETQDQQIGICKATREAFGNRLDKLTDNHN
ncbi:MAG: hypothetical protein JSU86_07565 [Phycisphaerales bacterium]|nr:MAG: hypothetical protein JSU86_07565 [Phycisphaerales bacterium]